MLHIAPLTLKAQLLYLTVGAALTFVLAFCGLWTWRTMPFFKPPVPGQGRSHGFNGTGMTGIIVFFTFAGLSVALLVECSQYFVRYVFHPANSGQEWVVWQHAAIAAQVALALFFFLTGVISFVQWGSNPAKCGFIFCIGVESHPRVAKARGDSFNALLSLVFMVTLVPLSCVMWYRVFTLWQLQKAVRAAVSSELVAFAFVDETPASLAPKEETKDIDGSVYAVNADNSPAKDSSGLLNAVAANPMAKPPSMRAYVATPWKKQLSRIVGLCLGIVACAMLSFWLPNDPRKVSAFGIASYARVGISREHRSGNTTVPEMPYAWFRTGQIRLSENLVLKLYPGNVFFYVYLLSAAVIVFVLRQAQTGRYWMQRRMPWCACLTYGEAAFAAATAWLMVFFCIYWVRDHNFKSSWTVDNPEWMKVESAERWGRGLGQLAILFLSLLLLPVGRQSVVVTVLGVSRDGLLWFHRAVGYAMLAATLGHIIAFYFSYAEYGLLWHNLNSIPTIVGHKGVFDDYTVTLATWTTWFLLIAMGVFALRPVRRRCYELFYYTHLAATYMTLPAMLFHASAGWMYMLPGLTVFLADQLVRVWQRSAVVRVVHARTISEDTVELAFSVPGRWDMRRVHPGQYVLVCVPELTALQWHPFTLTSVVDDCGDGGDGAGVAVSTTGTVFYLHIKSMGPRTWTGRLHDMVRCGQVFSVGVEGPCGTPVDYSRYDDVVLVAGGIGAAPCVSVYGSLLRAYLCGRDGACVPRVRMVWSTRSASLVGAVADMLQLPVSYRCLVRAPRRRGDGGDPALSCTPAAHHAGATVEVPASAQVRNDDFTLDVYVTRGGELARFAALDDKLHDTRAAAAAAARHGDAHESGTARELPEELPDAHAATQQVGGFVPGAVNRGARLRVFEGRPDVGHEIRRALVNPATNVVEGDVKRKLVLVCGPEGMVADAVSAAAEIGVAVHTEEFLF